jgi:hypothetical protein
MNDERIEECEAILAREEGLARTAPSEAAAELHRQKASLYRTRLGLLKRGLEPAQAALQLSADR